MLLVAADATRELLMLHGRRWEISEVRPKACYLWLLMLPGGWWEILEYGAKQCCLWWMMLPGDS